MWAYDETEVHRVLEKTTGGAFTQPWVCGGRGPGSGFHC